MQSETKEHLPPTIRNVNFNVTSKNTLKMISSSSPSPDVSDNDDKDDNEHKSTSSTSTEYTAKQKKELQHSWQRDILEMAMEEDDEQTFHEYLNGVGGVNPTMLSATW